MRLRPYQSELIQKTAVALKKHRRVIMCAPTGSGKTFVFSNIISRHLKAGMFNRVLVLTHRTELFSQSVKAVVNTGTTVTELKAGMKTGRHHSECRCLVAMVETLKRRKLDLFGNFSLIIIDEAHRADFNKIIEHYGDDTYIIGATATPISASKKRPLKNYYNDIAISVGINDLIEAGYLAKPRHYKADFDDSNLKVRAGEYTTQSQFESLSTKVQYENHVELWRKYAGAKKTIVFCVNKEHTIETTAKFQQGGISADYILSGDPDRDSKIEAFRVGGIQVLLNCEIATTGFDIPDIECVDINRATQSLPLWLQMCLDLDTEVLTQTGWKRHDEVSDDDVVASFNPETEEINFERHLGKTFREVYPGEYFFKAKGPMVDFEVTGGHDMLIRSRRARSKKWSKITARDLSERRSEYLLPVCGLDRSEGIGLSEDELRFIGWFLADGTINKANNAICISQSKAQPKSHHKSIIDSIMGCGFKYGKTVIKRTGDLSKYSDLIQYRISKGAPRSTDKHLTGWGRMSKYLDKNISDELFKCTHKELSIILEGIHLGDGAKQKGQPWTRRSYHIAAGDNKVYADRLQALCVTKGFKCNLSTQFYNKNPIHILHIKKRNFLYMRGKYQKDGTSIEKREACPREKVWCLTTVDGTLVTRRNGKVLIMGNCGRGSRTAPGKTEFTILDFGGNIDRHGLWNAPYDWKQIFFNPGVAGENPAPHRECERCGWLMFASIRICPGCGAVQPTPEQKEAERVRGYLEEVGATHVEGSYIEDLSISDLYHLEKTGKYKPSFIARVARTRGEDALAEYAKMKGYKPGWIRHQSGMTKGYSNYRVKL